MSDINEANEHYEKNRAISENIGAAYGRDEKIPQRVQDMQRAANKKQFQALKAVSDENRRKLINTGKYEATKKAVEALRRQSR